MKRRKKTPKHLRRWLGEPTDVGLLIEKSEEEKGQEVETEGSESG